MIAKNTLKDPFSAITGMDAMLLEQRIRDKALYDSRALRNEIDGQREESILTIDAIQEAINEGEDYSVGCLLEDNVMNQIPKSKRGELALKVAELMHEVHEAIIAFAFPGADVLLAAKALEEREVAMANYYRLVYPTGQVGLSFRETAKMMGVGSHEGMPKKVIGKPNAPYMLPKRRA